ncbi:MAG: NUDIX domain-containing protein [Thermoleophilia bacterium]
MRRDASVSPRTGKEHEFVVLESPDWVAVLALTEDGSLVLVRQFRHGLRRLTLELPGGLVDEGMTPMEAARAELRQETGYGDGEWTELGRLAPLPAVFTNHLHVFLARGVRLLGEPDLDPGEDIATELVTVDETRRMVAEGEIVHAPVAAALFLWELRSPGGVDVDVDVDEPTVVPVAPLRERILQQLRGHFTATVATVGRATESAPPATGAGASGVPDTAAESPRDDTAGLPHAATVFYAADRRGRLVFLSKGDSRHGRDIGTGAPVAVSVAREYADWKQIQGVQLWGRAEPLKGASRARALATYLARFPFVGALLEEPRLAARLRGLEVYRVTPRRAALTDNRSGPFGREVLEEL